jgi:ribosomal protein S12 methylthiotransferase
MLTQQKIVFEKNKNKVGSELLCLVDSVDQQGGGIARYYGQAPEIDSVCIINNCRAAAGEFIKTKVTDYDNYDLIVEQI